MDGGGVADLGAGADDEGDEFGDGLGLVGAVAGVEEDAADGGAEKLEDVPEAGLADFLRVAVLVLEMEAAGAAVPAEMEDVRLEGHQLTQQVVGGGGDDGFEVEPVPMGGAAQDLLDVAELGVAGEAGEAHLSGRGALRDWAGTAKEDAHLLGGIIVAGLGVDLPGVAAEVVDELDEVVGDLVLLNVEVALGPDAEAAVAL